MIVYLLRHGIAEDGIGIPDEARRLTDEGRKRLERAAPAWRRLIPGVQKVVHSPLVRAEETAAIFCRAIGGKPAVEVDGALVPSAPPGTMLERLQAEVLEGTQSLACVGHEPHLGSLFGLLVTGAGRSSIPLKKGMLVAVEVDSASHMVGRLRFAVGQKVAGQF